MLKNRFFSVFALVALVGLTACETEEAEVEPIVEEPVVTEPVTAPATEPVVTEPVVTEPVVGEGAAVEIPGNGIDDDNDGLIDEEV